MKVKEHYLDQRSEAVLAAFRSDIGQIEFDCRQAVQALVAATSEDHARHVIESELSFARKGKPQ